MRKTDILGMTTIGVLGGVVRGKYLQETFQGGAACLSQAQRIGFGASKLSLLAIGTAGNSMR